MDLVVRTHRSGEALATQDELAWRLATLAGDPVAVDEDVREMIINRVIDDVAVATASLNRSAPRAARDQALAYRRAKGSHVWGCAPDVKVPPEWAAWANGVAVRELDFHDTFLAAEYAHPGDSIPSLLSVAQYVGERFALTGDNLIRAIATAYEVQIDLSRTISLHAHKIDHVAHLGPAIAAGLGTLLGLDTPVIYQAINQSLHLTTATRQSRKGNISTWKAYAPAFAAKVAIEAVDRAMRGQSSPSPIYEGEDGVIAWLLDGPDAQYRVALPRIGEPKRAILESFTKEYSAEYQAQAWIDLARRVREQDSRVMDSSMVRDIVISTSHHTHFVIGTGSGDPQKFDPRASRETLDHSLPYIFAVALQDGLWHHENSYAPERSARLDTQELWHKISTREDSEWSARYLASDPNRRAYGGRVRFQFTDGSEMVEEIEVPDAHPRGRRPFGRSQYLEKFRTLTEGVVTDDERERFVDVVSRLGSLSTHELGEIFLRANGDLVTATTHGIL